MSAFFSHKRPVFTEVHEEFLCEKRRFTHKYSL